MAGFITEYQVKFKVVDSYLLGGIGEAQQELTSVPSAPSGQIPNVVKLSVQVSLLHCKSRR